MRKAFTLVELAIVMTIVGLLIGGVLKGQELLENSRMTALGTNIKSYQAAITTFRDIYKCVPGDCLAATSYIKGCVAGNNCSNGDGGGTINLADGFWWYGFDAVEPFQAWKHLALADLIKGVDTTRARTAASYRGSIDVPATPFGGQMYIKTATAGAAAQFAGQVNIGGQVVVASQSTNGGTPVTSGELFAPALAQKIDLKIDDGIAFTGDAMSVSDVWAMGCGSTSNGTTGYNVNVGGRTCAMGFTLGN